MEQLMRNRHSVKSYTDKPIEGTVLARLREEIDAANDIGGLNIQLVLDDPKAFTGFMAKYQNFKNVRNYLAMVGPNSARLDEQCGYFGEHLVLIAQGLGLNTCWAGLGFNRKKASIDKPEGHRAAIAIAIGYGQNQGASGKMPAPGDISNLSSNSPAWFREGIEAVTFAPTVMDEQGTRFDLMEDTNKNGKPFVRAMAAPKGHFNYVDLGIARYHFEVGAGVQNFAWM